MVSTRIRNFIRSQVNYYSQSLALVPQLDIQLCSPFPFGRICFVVLVMKKGGESS